jgi:allophanate hydrolase subunit 2
MIKKFKHETENLMEKVDVACDQISLEEFRNYRRKSVIKRDFEVFEDSERMTMMLLDQCLQTSLYCIVLYCIVLYLLTRPTYNVRYRH